MSLTQVHPNQMNAHYGHPHDMKLLFKERKCRDCGFVQKNLPRCCHSYSLKSPQSRMASLSESFRSFY